MYGKRFVTYTLCFLLVVAIAAPAQAQIEIADVEVYGQNWNLYMTTHAVGAIQLIDEDDVSIFSRRLGLIPKPNPADDMTFHTTFGGIDWDLQMGDYAHLFYDVTLATRVRPDRVWSHEGYLRIEKFPEGFPLSFLNRSIMRSMDLKIGEFDLNYGWYPQTSSINAATTKNPLVGNYIVRPLATEPGGEFIFNGDRANLLLGFSNASPTEDAQDGREFAYHGKVWGNLTPGVELALSFFTQDNSDAPGAFGCHGHLFAVERIGGRYADVFDGGDAPGTLIPGAGCDETAWQVDLRSNPLAKLGINALWGNYEDDDVNATAPGEPEQSWDYYGGQVKYDLNEHFYVAGRYSAAEVDNWNNAAGLSTSEGEVERLQLGAGMWVMPGFLTKLEYVDEEVDDFQGAAGTLASLGALGVDGTRGPQFDGLVAEFVMKF